MQRSGLGVIAGRLRWLMVGLIALSTILFLTGVAIEKSGSATTVTREQQAGQTPTNSGDPDGGHEGSPSQAATTQAAVPAEAVLGLDIEAPGFLAAFLLVWLVLVIALFRFGRPALMALLLVAAATVMLDGAEVVHQMKEANTTLVTLAVLVALTHLVIAALAVLALLSKRGTLADAAR